MSFNTADDSFTFTLIYLAVNTETLRHRLCGCSVDINLSVCFPCLKII